MFKKMDWVLLAALVILGIAMTIIIYRPASSAGSTVIIKENGIRTQAYPLSHNATYTITNGDGTNTLTIQDGYASITDANCHDYYCIRQGKINQPGQSIICLPHRLSIEIQGEGDIIDGISQ